MQNHLHDTLGYFIILTSIVSNIPQLIKICIYKNDKNKVGERSLISFGFYCSINVAYNLRFYIKTNRSCIDNN